MLYEMRFRLLFVSLLVAFPVAFTQQLYPTPPLGDIGSCPQLTNDTTIFGSRTAFSDQGLLPTLFIGSDVTSPPFLRVVRARLTCETIGLERDTASSVSFLVEYQNQNSPGTNLLARVTLDCIPDPQNPNSEFSFFPTPINNQLSARNTATSRNGVTLSTSGITGTFSTEPKTDCGACGGTLDPVTRCQSCRDCVVGMLRCVGRDQVSDQCCSYFLNNTCVQVCPTPLQPNMQTFDCGCEPLSSANGDVSYSNDFLIGSVATYSCDAATGYVLPEGPITTRTCTMAGWNGDAPTCALHDCKFTNLFNPQNGKFSLQSNGLTTYGSVVSFKCDDDKYQLSGVETRTCGLTGWSDSNPTCELKMFNCGNCNSGNCDSSTGMCQCPASKTGTDCSEDSNPDASTGGGCGTPCIIGIVLAVVGAIILVAVVTGVAYGIYSYLNHPDTKMAKFDNEQFNGVARDNPLYVDPDAVVGDGAEAA